MGIKPRIFRKIKVPSKIKLSVFHDKIITPLFGYKRNFHSYMFLPKRQDKRISYGPIYSQSVDKTHIGVFPAYFYKLGSIMIDSNLVHLCDVLNEKNKEMKYIYDLGDQYWHKIILEEIIECDNNKNLVEIYDGSHSIILENTKGNWGLVQRLNKLSSYRVSQKDWEECITSLINAPNFHHLTDKFWWNFNNFNKSLFEKKIKKYFRTFLARQDAISMKRYPYGKYAYQPKEAANYVKGQDYEDSKKFFKQFRGVRRCAYCDELDAKDINFKTVRTVLKCCSRCLSMFYCGRRCQKKHWNTHHRYYCFDKDRFN